MVEELKQFEDDDEDEIIDGSPEYSPKSDFSKAKQVDAAFTKVVELRAKEMRAGYWNMEIKNGFPIKQWIPDSRKAFISSINAIVALLAPEITRDKHYENKTKSLKKRMKELEDTFAYQEKQLIMKEDNKTMGGIPVWKSTGVKYIPEIGATVTVQNNLQPQMGNTIQGGWDDKVNAYWDNLVLVYDGFFAELNQVIDRLNYFKQAMSY